MFGQQASQQYHFGQQITDQMTQGSFSSYAQTPVRRFEQRDGNSNRQHEDTLLLPPQKPRSQFSQANDLSSVARRLDFAAAESSNFKQASTFNKNMFDIATKIIDSSPQNPCNYQISYMRPSLNTQSNVNNPNILKFR